MELAVLSWTLRVQELEELLQARRQELELQQHRTREEQERLEKQQKSREKVHRQLIHLRAEEAQLEAGIVSLQYHAEEVAATPFVSGAHRPLKEAKERAELLHKVMQADARQTQHFETLIKAKQQKGEARLEALRMLECQLRDKLTKYTATSVSQLERALSLANADVEKLKGQRDLAEKKLCSLQLQYAKEDAATTGLPLVAEQVSRVKAEIDAKKVKVKGLRKDHAQLEERLQHVQRAKQQAVAKQDELQQRIKGNAEIISGLYS